MVSLDPPANLSSASLLPLGGFGVRAQIATVRPMPATTSSAGVASAGHERGVTSLGPKRTERDVAGLWIFLETARSGREILVATTEWVASVDAAAPRCNNMG